MINAYTFEHIAYFDTSDTISSNDKPVLVILHGWRQNKESWLPVIQLLASQYRVICPDLPAFGESIDSSFLSYAIEDYANTITALLDHLDIQKYSILTHSFGGRIGVLLAATDRRNRIASLILFASPGLEKHTLSTYIKSFVIAIGKLVKRSIVYNIPFVPKLETTVKTTLASTDYSQAQTLKKIFLHSIIFDIKPYLSRIYIPTLIIWGDKDNALPVAQAYAFHEYLFRTPDVQTVILKGYGHFAHIDAPNLFSAKILSFLQSHV